MSERTHIIVGAGPAGAFAIQAMRAAGFAGRIVLIGDEAHLPYERPPLSKAHLLDPLSAGSPAMFDAEYYARHRVQLMLAKAVIGVDRLAQRVALVDGTRVPYDRVLIATGGRARRQTIEGANKPNVHLLRTLPDSVAVE